MRLYERRKNPLYEFFTIDGVSSLDFGIRIEPGGGIDDKAERDFDSIAIPGRNGELTIDNGRYKNVDFVYNAFTAEGFNINLSAFCDFLNSSHGYHMIEDTFHPGEYIMARYTGKLTPETITRNSGRFEIPFNRMPQRFLSRLRRRGHVYTGARPRKLYNPTGMPALPKIILTPVENAPITSVRLYFNDSLLLTVADVTAALTIDSEKRQIHMNGADMYEKTTFAQETIADGFPVFGEGVTNFAATPNTYFTFTVFPNWWRL